ncbi:uncharacterized protein LOC116288123 [Actinia tenebrosa]|uniref:Uncharacterized protein LOC116288123 n=1 Tax=Actinia tenebrosa TaxID=6105 RepID=A0A6P8H5I9_ACTTE|nr:uncharacterized protein LOC116288123 [Actinia tenebrosa]
MSKEFGGKTTSWVTVLLYVTFIILNVYSMVIMMLERYVAIAFGMTYKAWTSKAKASIGIAVVWGSAVIVSLTTLISVLDIDLGDKPVHVYRGEYFKKAVRYSFLVNVLLSIFGIIILSLLTFKSIKLQTSQVVFPKTTSWSTRSSGENERFNRVITGQCLRRFRSLNIRNQKQLNFLQMQITKVQTKEIHHPRKQDMEPYYRKTETLLDN